MSEYVQSRTAARPGGLLLPNFLIERFPGLSWERLACAAALWERAGGRAATITVTPAAIGERMKRDTGNVRKYFAGLIEVGLVELVEQNKRSGVWTLFVRDPREVPTFGCVEPSNEDQKEFWPEEPVDDRAADAHADAPPSVAFTRQAADAHADAPPDGGCARESAAQTSEPTADEETTTSTQTTACRTFAEQRAARNKNLSSAARESLRGHGREDIRPGNIRSNQDVRPIPGLRPNSAGAASSSDPQPAAIGGVLAMATPEAQAAIAAANAREVDALSGYILDRVGDPDFSPKLARRAAECVGVGTFTREVIEQILGDLDAHVHAGTLRSTRHGYFFGAVWNACGEHGVPRDEWQAERRRRMQQARSPPQRR